jgi:hypothetical protein
MFCPIFGQVESWLHATDSMEELEQAAARKVVLDYIVGQLPPFPSDEHFALLGRVQAAYEFVA